ncbi:MAG: twin-arginine translocation signal domain-containing protein [Candidatus Hydrogenedentes bacterium]|nr:twin-arginine translocation signal domain-containing protein [Candidatus Hydrogenedentota bacterium]
MKKDLHRRDFLKRSAATVSGLGLVGSFEEMALAQAAARQPAPTPPAPAAANLPKAKVGNVEISRLICGGNLISGYAHSRDLIYVSPLLKHYFTDEKIFETFRLCEDNGVNTAMLKLDDDTVRLLNVYWHVEGGNIQWISQITNPADLTGEINRSLDNGAVGVFTTGQMGDELVRAGQVDAIAKAVETVKKRGAIAGVSCHEINVVIECERRGVGADFYMKTFNSKNYWSAKPAERYDSVFDETPQKTIEVMAGVKTPWVAFKVLGAGAITPREGFDYAVQNGADFLCVGMFDFQVQEDVRTAQEIFNKHQTRPRPWRA